MTDEETELHAILLILVTLRASSSQRESTEAVAAPRPGLRRGAVDALGQVLCRASRRIVMAWATAARVAWVPLSGLSIMKSWVMPS
jgi:hypothetical protein